MMALVDWVKTDLSVTVPPEVGEAAGRLAARPDAAAILFYGSVLRTGNLDDLLDFYVLTDDVDYSPRRPAPLVWPTVTFHELPVGGRTVRAKVATMPLDIFAQAASGKRLDTTIWTRFSQRSALVWTSGPAHADRVARAITSAIITAARFAAVLGPKAARPEDFWKALFDETYHTEFRVEAPCRSAQIVEQDRARYAALLPIAWREAGICFTRSGESLRPDLSFADLRRLIAGWWIRSALGKPLNIVRLLKAAFTFQGAARYALWKIERHMGVRIEATGWRERHPVLAAPGVLWRLLRAKPQRYSAQ